MRRVFRWKPVTLLRVLGPLLLLALVPSLEGCDDGTSPQITHVQVLLTDAPVDFIESAEVWISRVYLQACPEGEEGEGPECTGEDLFNDPENPQYYDLLTLQDGVTAELTGFEPVEATVYRQLRLVVDEAIITLKEGYEFEDPEDPEYPGVATLPVPSGAESGIKVHLTEAIDGEPEEVTIIVVDFDVNENFVLQGPEPTPPAEGEIALIRGLSFTPTLNEKGRSHQVM